MHHHKWLMLSVCSSMMSRKSLLSVKAVVVMRACFWWLMPPFSYWWFDCRNHLNRISWIRCKRTIWFCGYAIASSQATLSLSGTAPILWVGIMFLFETAPFILPLKHSWNNNSCVPFFSSPIQEHVLWTDNCPSVCITGMHAGILLVDLIEES